MGAEAGRQREAAGEEESGKMAEVDMELRDPVVLNNHTKVFFEEVLAEPEGVRSIDCVWTNGFKCFNGTLSCCYKFLTILCGIPLAFCWGCEFACTACYHVWYLTPAIREMGILCKTTAMQCQICLGACMSPMMQSCGNCLSQIRMRDGPAPEASSTVTTVTRQTIVRTVVEVDEKPTKTASPTPSSVHGEDSEKQD